MKKILSSRTILFIALLVAFITVTYLPADAAGVTVYKKEGKYVKLGGRIQLQYHHQDPDSGESEDSLFLRRFRPYIEGSIHRDWSGKLQFDMGKSSGDNELSIKDAWIRYKGIENTKITVGNQNFTFSRERMTSSKKQQFVERTFVGDHNYGTPDRSLGAQVNGHFSDRKITYGLGFGSESIDPDGDKLDFDTPVNRNSDFNEGWIVGGRVDYHPLGYLPFSQGDFDRETKVTIGIAAFAWANDNDNNTYTEGGSDKSGGAKPDVDSATGFEISGGFRSHGFSADAQYNIFKADTVDSAVTGGIYKDGTTNLTNYAIEGGYMVIPDRLELVAGYEVQDADNYAEEWTRTSVGANLFIKKHDIKFQLTYRMGENLKGKSGNDENELFGQMQFVF